VKNGISVLAILLLIDVVLIDQWMMNTISKKTVIGLLVYLVLSAFLAIASRRLKSKWRDKDIQILTQRQLIIYEQLLQSLQLCLLNLVLMKGLVSYFEGSSFFNTPLRIDVIIFFIAMSFIGHPFLTMINKEKQTAFKMGAIIKMIGFTIVVLYLLYYFEKLQMSVYFFNQPVSGLLMLVTFLLNRYIFKLIKPV